MKLISTLLLSLISTTVAIDTVQAETMTKTNDKTDVASEVVVSATKTILTRHYRFNERSVRVKKLQRVLGNVYVDGIYGHQTRRAHVRKLKKLGLPTANVPAAPVKVVRYNISYKSSRRCPQFESAFEAYGLKPVDVFSYIAWRETRCDPSKANARWKNGKIVWTLNKDGSYDVGLLQINSTWRTVTSQVCGTKWGDMSALYNVDCNLKVAKFLLDNTDGGLGNWRVYKLS